MKSVLIIGMGRTGRHLASKMQELGNDVMIVDKNPAIIEALSGRFTDSNICDCTNDAIIKALSTSASSPSARTSRPRSSSRPCSSSSARA